MSAVDLPSSVLVLLLWGVPALVVVLGARYVLRKRRPPEPEAGGSPDPNRLLVPAAAHDRYARATWLGWSTPDAAGRSRRPRIVATGVILALLAVGSGAFIFPRSRSPRPAEPDTESVDWRELTGSATAATLTSSPAMSAQSAVDPETGERLILWSGNEQTGRPGRLLLRSLGVGVLDSVGRPVPDRAIRFEPASGGGAVEQSEVRTTGSGLALTSWRLGTDPEALSVRAYLADRPSVSVRFTARLDPAASGVRPDPVSDLEADADGAPADEPGPSDAPGADPAAGELAAASSGETSDAPDATAEAADDAASDPEPEAAEPSAAGRASSGVAVIGGRSAGWSPGGMHTCRVGSAGGVACLGAGGAAAGRAAGSRVRAVEAGVAHVCGITESSTVACWAVGSGGSAAVSGERSLPEGEEPVELAVGSEHVCARSAAGHVYCWGSNTRGQLGTAGPDRTEPERVASLGGVVRIASGWFHSCALTGAGQLYCWGANGSGQLGLGSAGDRSSPGRVPRPAPFRRISAGSAHTCAITAPGEAWCWGENRYGQLGTGSTERASRPVRVDTRLTFDQVAAGGVHTCGLTESGSAWCWGRNVFGQLGDGSTQDSPIPMPVRGEHRFQRLAGGGAHSCGESADGALYCWGSNIQGQLGDGSRENRAEPVRSAGSR